MPSSSKSWTAVFRTSPILYRVAFQLLESIKLSQKTVQVVNAVFSEITVENRALRFGNGGKTAHHALPKLIVSHFHIGRALQNANLTLPREASFSQPGGSPTLGGGLEGRLDLACGILWFETKLLQHLIDPIVRGGKKLVSQKGRQRVHRRGILRGLHRLVGTQQLAHATCDAVAHCVEIRF